MSVLGPAFGPKEGSNYELWLRATACKGPGNPQQSKGAVR